MARLMPVQKVNKSTNGIFRQRSPVEIPLPGFYYLKTGETASPAVEGEKTWQLHANKKTSRDIHVSEGIITKTAACIWRLRLDAISSAVIVRVCTIAPTNLAPVSPAGSSRLPRRYRRFVM
jgi:hypothetical protein